MTSCTTTVFKVGSMFTPAWDTNIARRNRIYSSDAMFISAWTQARMYVQYAPAAAHEFIIFRRYDKITIIDSFIDYRDMSSRTWNAVAFHVLFANMLDGDQEAFKALLDPPAGCIWDGHIYNIWLSPLV